jgi:polyphenol oxidase
MSTQQKALIRRERDGVIWYEPAALAARPGVVAAFTTRHGGVSTDGLASLNLSYRVSDDPDRVAENRRRLSQALDLGQRPVVAAGQVHGGRVAVVGGATGPPVVPDVDGLITTARDVALMLLFADCVPLLAYDPECQAVGVGHAGWRGTLAGLAGDLVAAMQRELGSTPRDLCVAIGPSIGACCYVVGGAVAEAFRQRWPDDVGAYLRPDGPAWRLDLREANRRQLLGAGVPSDQISPAEICTSCRVDEFYSHRAQGGQAGRFAAIIALEHGSGAVSLTS